MSKRILAVCLSAVLLASAGARAAVLSVAVTDRGGRPAADTVVTLVPFSNASAAIVSHAPENAIIDQRKETFLPLVVVVRKGGRVTFTNNDATKHQVYSFSPIKQFQFVVSQGETSSPVVFDQAGIAAIGCNIHDQMIAYVFVADQPYAVASDAKGRAEISDVHDGSYRVLFWHPQMHSMTPEQGGTVDVKGATAELKGSISITLDTTSHMKPMHMSY
jgi:plastocyanin